MDAKLTLRLDKRVADRAKSYAKRNRKSLSVLVENYFRTLLGSESFDSEPKNTTLVEELSGVLPLGAQNDRKK